MIKQLKNVRLSFPHLFKGQVNDKGETSFGAVLLIPTKDPQNKELYDIMLKVATDKWGDKGPAVFKALFGTKTCLKDGALKAAEGLAGYEGNWYLSANAKTRPTVFDSDLTPIVDQSVGRPYGGCFVNASIDIYAYEKQEHGKGIYASLRGIQFVGHGDAFGGSTPATANEFEAIESVEPKNAFGGDTGKPNMNSETKVNPFLAAPAKDVVPNIDLSGNPFGS